jgi:N6-L-threonylcarbamoyladenine synthase
MHILAIESSCDETSAAIISNGKICSNVVSTQAIHQLYGGVVPELASRAHQQQIVWVVNKALADAKIHKNQLNGIAFTRGPGLMGALIVGTSFAKAMALGLGIPLIDVQHMHAHVLAHFIDLPQPKFPFLCLTVSGGHTQIVKVSDHLHMQIIGQTHDDAVGEAFDKAAKLLGLPYPGGPLLDKLAQNGDSSRFKFPKPDMPGYDFSFSGVKTAIVYFLQKNTAAESDFIEKNMADICASIQQTLVDILLKKLMKAAKELGINDLAIAGGVSANSLLRAQLAAEATKRGYNYFIPKFEYCTDNAAMIAIAAHYKYLAEQFTDQGVSPQSRMTF